MKKILFFAGILLLGFGSASAQEQQMKLGGNLAIPVGELGNYSSIGLQANFSYLFTIEGNLQAGPSAELFYYNTKKRYKDFWVLPLGGEARYNINDFFVGINLGYGVGIAPKGNDGGFYYRPKIGYHLGNPDMALIFSYSGLSSSGENASSINFGIEVTF